MKRILLFALLFTLAVTFELCPGEAQAQTKPNAWTEKSACQTALASGEYAVYTPKYFGLHGKNPVNNVDRVLIPLETTECRFQLTTSGMRWVVVPEGTKMRARKLTDGSLEIDARDDCGNPDKTPRVAEPVTEATKVAEAKPEPEIKLIPGPAGPQGPEGPKGDPGESCTFVINEKGETWQVCPDGTRVLMNRPMSRGKKVAVGAAVGGAIAWGTWTTGKILCWW